MITYRDATPADGPALDAMAREIWIATFGHSAPAADITAYVAKAYGPDGALLRDLVDPAIHFRLAVEADRIVGYAKLTQPWLVEAANQRGALQLSQLYVVADRHGHGIAQALMDWTIATARQRGAPALFLTVWEENARARRFYERYGFVHVGYYAFHTGSQIDRDEVMRLML
ncbi:GNAT family N-acetyltransferase [Sphingomonas sp. R86521]|uniref:GNAT family N-acetyltransferase n=1 Tax=Sphingomonas sp. R86521 TaxID=3093860 RepID=UPI0036D35803